MKIIQYFLSVVSVGFLLGCATTFQPSELSKLKVGMNRDEILLLLGKPDSSKKIANGGEILVYTYCEDYVHNSDDDSFSTTYSSSLEKRQFEKSLKTDTYVVHLVDGKMVDYKKKK